MKALQLLLFPLSLACCISMVTSLYTGASGYDCADVSFKNAKTGKFHSPNYPNDYPNTASCVYRIEVPEGSIVELNIYDLRTEACCDKLYVYDGDAQFDEHNKTTATVLATLKGDALPYGVVKSSGRTMTLNFVTDMSTVFRGFFARFDAVPGNDSNNPTMTACPPDNSFTNAWDVFISPKWPEHYQAQAHCDYSIEVASGKRIKLRVNHFYTEACCDYLRVKNTKSNDVDDQGNDLGHKTLRGNLKENYTVESKTNRLDMTFISDPTVEIDGFSITYTTID